MGLGVFVAVFWHLGEDGLGITTEDGELKEQRGVEHDVGVLLIREDPAVFATTDGGPTRDGVARREAAEVVVAHDATKQTGVGGGDPGVVVQRDGGEGRDVEFEDAALVDLGEELGVEGVDAFDDQYHVVGHLHGLTVVVAVAVFEVEGWEFHLLACQQLVELGVEEVEVDGVEMLEVPFAVLVFGCVFAVDEVVVHGEDHGADAEHGELHGEAFAEGGLAGGGWARDHDDLDVAALLDLVGDGGDEFLMECLVDLEEFAAVVLVHQAVEVADVVEVHDIVPLHELVEGAEHLGLWHDGCECLGVLDVRHAEEESVLVFLDVEDRYVAC